MREMAFSQVDTLPRDTPGVYEIRTRAGIPLKVGIAADVRHRLRQHLASRQAALKLKPGGNRSNPADVLSKQSILAKHLYYDREIAPGFDLTTEAGRRGFLERDCVFVVELTETRSLAREIERVREKSGHFRYLGRVKTREH